MLERRHHPDLRQEALGAQRHGQLGLEHLERHVPVVLEVAGEIDGGHPALAELALDPVAVAERGREAFSGRCHAALPHWASASRPPAVRQREPGHVEVELPNDRREPRVRPNRIVRLVRASVRARSRWGSRAAASSSASSAPGQSSSPSRANDQARRPARRTGRQCLQRAAGLPRLPRVRHRARMTRPPCPGASECRSGRAVVRAWAAASSGVPTRSSTQRLTALRLTLSGSSARACRIVARASSARPRSASAQPL